MTTEPDGKKSAAGAAAASSKPPGYPEHDKLGPLPSPAIPPRGLPLAGGDLRAAILAAFKESLDRAQRAADGGASNLDESVHEYRKSLRRARAVLGLVAETLSDHDGDDIADALRTARRAVAASRDHSVAPAALASLELDASNRATADAIVAAARAAAPAAEEVQRLLREGATVAATTENMLAAALPPELDWKMLADGLAETYRAARRQLRKAKRSRRSLHAWRRRTKELSYQLDLVAAGAGDEVGGLAKRVNDVSDQLGDVVDLVMVRDFIAANATGLDAAVLGAAVDGALQDRARAARRAGKELFDRGGRRFARRLTKAVRRDLAPAPPSPAGNGVGLSSESSS